MMYSMMCFGKEDMIVSANIFISKVKIRLGKNSYPTLWKGCPMGNSKTVHLMILLYLEPNIGLLA